jgi:hypothetical protein
VEQVHENMGALEVIPLLTEKLMARLESTA